MGRKREVPAEIKANRRKILDAGMKAYGEAVDAGDEAGAAAGLEAMKVLGLVVEAPNGLLATGPDVADEPG
jgi:hypothetical protein